MATSDFSTGKTIFVLAIVVGCFAILWPRVFHPMVQTAFSMTKTQINNEKSANVRPAAGCCDVVYDYDINNNFFARLCELVVHRQEMVGIPPVKGIKGTPPTKSLLPKQGTPGVTQMCRDTVLELCHVDIGAVLTEDPKKPKYAEILEDLRNQNVSYCLRRHYEKHEKFVELAQKMRHRRFLTARKQPVRSAHSPLLHPAMRERGVPIATRIREPFAHKQKNSFPNQNIPPCLAHLMLGSSQMPSC